MADGVVLAVVSVLALVAVASVVFALATDDRDPSIVLAWLFLILIVPLLGVVAYFFVGRNHRLPGRSRTRQRHRLVRATSERNLAATSESTRVFAEAAAKEIGDTPAGRVVALTVREGGTACLPADSCRLYYAGIDKFRDLLAELADAREFVHLMYLIWEQDELTAEVTSILLDRLAAGVKVHILYDWLSSMPYKKAELRRLSAAGAVVLPCYRRLPQLNYRNHMKMVIIDGRVVYSGGMNMGQEYIDGGERFATWRDTHFRLTGPVVAPYLDLFASTWTATGGTGDLFTGYLPPPSPRLPGEGTPVQVLHSSVSTPAASIRDLFIVALTSARQRVWIQSPYFVPDEPTLTAMCVAAASGVDVRLMITGHPDKKVPFHAAHAYFGQLLASDVRVFLYTAGFLHAKTVTMDDDVAVVGTCNWDIRSLLLHDEVVAVLHDHERAREFGTRYEQDLRFCREITRADMDRLGPGRRVRNSLCRLTSRLL